MSDKILTHQEVGETEWHRSNPNHAGHVSRLQDSHEALRVRVSELEQAVTEMEPRCAFGDQCYQDRCEGAYVEQTVVKRMEAHISKLELEIVALEAACKGKTISCICGGEAVTRAEAAEAREKELREALTGLKALVESGILVRDTSQDGDAMRFMKQGVEIVQCLSEVEAALARVKEATDGNPQPTTAV